MGVISKLVVIAAIYKELHGGFNNSLGLRHVMYLRALEVIESNATNFSSNG